MSTSYLYKCILFYLLYGENKFNIGHTYTYIRAINISSIFQQKYEMYNNYFMERINIYTFSMKLRISKVSWIENILIK